MLHLASSIPQPPFGRRHGQVPAELLKPLRTAAAALLPRAGEIGTGMARELHELVPELHDDPGPELIEETRAMCVAHIGQALRMLAAGEPVTTSLTVPAEAIEYTRSCVHRGISLAALLRAYHLGQDYLLDEWTVVLAEGGRKCNTPASLRAVSSWMFAYVDRVCDRLAAEYAAAAESWSHSVAAIRAETARGILAGTTDDELVAARRLSYELRREHVGLVFWRMRGFPLDSAALSRAALAATEALKAAEPLIVLAGTAEIWVWCPHVTATPTEVQEALEPLEIEEGVGVGVGRKAAGIEGFRRTHVEAVAAARIAGLGGQQASAVTTYHAVELVALLTADLGAARVFVRHELGDLARPGRQAEQLRETVLAFLEEGMSNRRAARRLYCHQNTVAYRIARAEAVLGRPVQERRTELVAALILASTLGTAALCDAQGPP